MQGSRDSPRRLPRVPRFVCSALNAWAVAPRMPGNVKPGTVSCGRFSHGGRGGSEWTATGTGNGFSETSSANLRPSVPTTATKPATFAKTHPAPENALIPSVNAATPRNHLPPLPAFCAHCILVTSDLSPCLWRASSRRVFLCKECRNPALQLKNCGILLSNALAA